jgi:hypothetical protein
MFGEAVVDCGMENDLDVHLFIHYYLHLNDLSDARTIPPITAGYKLSAS